MGDASERPDPPSTWAEGALRVTRRPDTLVSPDGRPGPEQRRDLNRSSPLTRLVTDVDEKADPPRSTLCEGCKRFTSSKVGSKWKEDRPREQW